MQKEYARQTFVTHGKITQVSAGLKNGIAYRQAEMPEAGKLETLAEGVHWLRMPLPFALDHINLWVLDEDDGCTLVDCGLATEETREAWEAVFRDPAFKGPVRRVISTHFHPDHVGLAGWLCARWGAPLYMTQVEWLTGRMISLDTSTNIVANQTAFYRAAGCAEDFLAAVEARGNAYASRIEPIPAEFQRLRDTDTLSIGGRSWRIIVGRGHAPEHATLYCAELGMLISGDQILPRISPNVGVWANEPEAEPLSDFLASLESFKALPADTLVLPSHDRPFHGLHTRLNDLAAHHDARLADLLAILEQPKTAMAAAPALFRRKLDHHQTGFAVGEILAHLHLLRARKQVTRTLEADGIHRYQRT